MPARIISILCAISALCVSKPAPAETITIPLNEPVRVGQGTDATEIQPGTKEYYELRIKDQYHVENNTLVPSRVIFAEILQTLEDNRLWVRELIPASGGSGAATYHGFAPGEYLVVTAPSADGINAGSRLHLQVAQQDVFYLFETDKGTTGRARSARQVQSPSLEQYLELAGTSSENMGLVVSLDPQPPAPLPDTPGAAAPAMQREPAQIHLRHRPQDLSSMSDGDLAKRLNDFQHRRNLISRKLKQREEAAAHVRESMDAAQNEQEKKSREALLKKLQADVERVKFELEELNARYEELQQEHNSR
jgi:hypothetical protein